MTALSAVIGGVAPKSCARLALRAQASGPTGTFGIAPATPKDAPMNRALLTSTLMVAALAVWTLAASLALAAT